MTQKLTLDALEVIDAIDRKGSFAAAAAALYRVPSAVTYSMQKLEEDLDVTLFQREGRRAVLTPAGQLLLAEGRELLAAASRLTEATQQVHRGWETRLTIAVDTILQTKVIYPLLDRFYQLQPNIEISIIEEVLGGSWEAILQNRADLVIGCDEPPKKTAGLISKQLMQIDWAFVVSKNHPLAAQVEAANKPLSVDDILPYRAIIVRDSSRNLPPLSHRIFDKQPVLKVATMQEKIRCQEHGLGVGFLPLHRIQQELTAGDLRILPFEPSTPSSHIHVGWKRGNKGKALRWFAEQTQKLFQQ